MKTTIKSHKEFCEMAKEYKKSLKKINLKIEESTDKSKLTILRSISVNLKECIKELENYYKEDYWRNEKITMNSRKAIKIYFNSSEQE